VRDTQSVGPLLFTTQSVKSIELCNAALVVAHSSGTRVSHSGGWPKSRARSFFGRRSPSTALPSPQRLTKRRITTRSQNFLWRAKTPR
jgi:hypothetical protein